MNEAKQEVRRKFQFHTGSIKRKYGRSDLPFFEKFQFHTGSIKRKYGRSDLPFFEKFQFHTGSIKSQSTVPHLSLPFSVSIPHWFD